MRILVIENNVADLKHLVKLVKQISPAIHITGKVGSIKEAIEWFRQNPMPDLVFSVVQLPDGLSFEIFKQLHNRAPVIFTCLHDKYAIEAFKVNGIDYLLKPIKEEELRETLYRYETIVAAGHPVKDKEIQPIPYQDRFIVNIGKQMKLVKAEEIAYFYTENKIVYLVTGDGEKYTTEFCLEQLEEVLNSRFFFRINRQFIINISSIIKMLPASKSRLQLILRPATRHDPITSFERTASFRKWLMGLL